MEQTEDSTKQAARLVSLDAFRGLTIVGMLLVNNVALDIHTPKHLLHASWNSGINFADFVFPWFLFIVGAAIPYSAASHKKRELPRWRFIVKAANRAVILVLLGCLIDSSLSKRMVFDLGVLQVIGLAYLVGTIVYQLPSRWRLATAGAMLVCHWALIRFVHVPGTTGWVFNEDQNIIQFINDMYLKSYGLSGLISVIPTAALVVIGTAIGDMLRSEKIPKPRKTVYLVLAGVVLAVVGYLWSLDLPFNKPVWSASYIVYSAGWACAVLGLFYFVIDVKGLRWLGYPLVVFGANAIIAYVAPILIKIYILQGWYWTVAGGKSLPLQQAYMQYVVNLAGPIRGGWIYTASYIVVWWLVCLWLYRKKVFVRV